MPRQPDSIFLHLGHNKTGSTFQQSALAYSAPTLLEHGIFYPLEPKKAKSAQKGDIVGPNLGPRPGQVAQLAQLEYPDAASRILFSGEGLFFELCRSEDRVINDLREAYPGADLNVLLYLRDPVDHVVSFYHQRVKNGYTGTLGDRMANYSIPQKVIKVLSILKAAGAKVTVLNYSRHRDTLLNTMETWLSIPAGTLKTPVETRVNRSLTNAEVELQRAFNRLLGDEANALVSGPLTLNLPDIRSDTPPLSREDLAGFLDAMHEKLENPEFESLVPEAERPWIGTLEDHADRFPAPEDNPALCFSRDQIDVFAKAIVKQLRKAQNRTS